MNVNSNRGARLPLNACGCGKASEPIVHNEPLGEKGLLKIALAGNANVGKSLSGNEYIYVNNGGLWEIVKVGEMVSNLLKSSRAKKIGDIDVAMPPNLSIISLNLENLRVEKKKVTHVLRHKEGRKLIHLKTSSSRELSATKDHNFMILREGSLTVVNGEELSVGDQLPVVQKLRFDQSKPVLDLGDYISRTIGTDNRQYQILDDYVVVHGNRIPRLIKIDEAWARFFGLYVAEGSIALSTRVPRISTSKEELRSFLEHLLKRHVVPFNTVKDVSKSSYNIGISKALEPVLREFGSSSGEKKIPSFVYEWPEALIEPLLKGYFEGDGWKQVTATQAITKSIELQLGLLILLALTGKHSRLGAKEVGGTLYHGIRYVEKPSTKRAQWLESISGLGRILKQARESAGLTQLETVRKLSWKAVKGTQISALENERRDVTIKFLRRLVDVYRGNSQRENAALLTMEKLAFSDVAWDDIVEISEADADNGYVYDLTVEDNENFMLANGIFVHNSVVFNQLTGLHQHIGNWPGKTVERAEGTLHFKGYTIDVIDLPGIYSLSTYSMEELVSREYIVSEKPDLVINVIDATLLERNLFFTLQLMELETPLVIALNQVDLAKRKGIEIDLEKLEKALGVPVIPTVAVKGRGIYQLLDKAIETIESKTKQTRQCVSKEEIPQEGRPEKNRCCYNPLRYGNEIEARINKLTNALRGHEFKYPDRFLAIKLLEGDEEIVNEVSKIDPVIVSEAGELASDLEKIHSHSCSALMTSERYEVAGCIARDVQEVKSPLKPLVEERLDNITTNRFAGYPIMLAIMASIFVLVFTLGGWFSTLLSNLFYSLQPAFQGAFGTGVVSTLGWSVIDGVVAGITIALPYIIPFYVILELLENSGYLSRIAFLMDNLMHKMGLHGKAFIPMILGYGCNVPACLGCRIMETDRERLLAAFVTTLVPCAARTVVILGVVGAFLGLQWALAIYAFDLVLIFLLGRLAFKALPGEPTALIMEMPDYKMPHMKTVLKQTWLRSKDFVTMAFPIIIVGSFVLKLIDVTGLMGPLSVILSPVIVGWLGLPAITGIVLVFGVLRKELTLIMLVALLGTTNLALVLTPLQMIVFTIVVMLYIPCIATIGALLKEFGWKKASLITVFEIAFAIVVGGIALRLLAPLL